MSFCRPIRHPIVDDNGAMRALRSCAMTCARRDWLRALLRRSCHARCIDRVCLTAPSFFSFLCSSKQKSRKKESGASARASVSEPQVSHARDDLARHMRFGLLGPCPCTAGGPHARPDMYKFVHLTPKLQHLAPPPTHPPNGSFWTNNGGFDLPFQ